MSGPHSKCANFRTMYKARSSSPLLTLAVFLMATPSFAQAPEVDEEEVIADDEEIVADDEEVIADDEEIVADDEEVIADDEEIVADDEEVIADDEEIVADDEEVIADDAEVVAEEEVVAADPGPAVEEGLWEPGEEPYREPPAGKGVVWGRLSDTVQGEPVLEGSVKVKGRSEEAYVDFDGYYRLELPPGTYTLELFVPLHEQETLGNVSVNAGVVGRVDAQLTPQEGAVETVVIEDEAETQTVEGLALARQRSAAQGDAVGREEISKTTDSNAAEAAQRVVGANVVGGRFVYVRGLGERYSNSLLGGYPLPSPEPDRAAVPLDVFPTGVLDSLTIVKTFTPDMPADFAGGSVQIETRSVPAKPLFNVSLTGGVNTQATFQETLTQPKSATDWLGFDSGMRKMPASVPSDYPAKAGATKPDGSTVTKEELVQPGRDMNSQMSPEKRRAPMNHGISVIGGNTWDVGEGKLGVLASLNYSRKYENIEGGELANFDGDLGRPGGYVKLKDYTFDRGIEKVRWGAFGKVSYIPHPNHKFSITGLHSQLADDMTTFYQGYDDLVQTDYAASQLDWVERGMTFGLLNGEHIFPGLADAELGWDVSIAHAYRSEPDRRDTVYKANDRIPDPNDPRARLDGWTYIDKTESGRHFWASQDELSSGGKVDWRQPILEGETDLAVKFGGLINSKQRSFGVRRFQMRPGDLTDPIYSCLGETYQLNCPDQLFRDANIDTYLQLDEGSQVGDAYDAALNVYAGYALADVDFSEQLRVVGGARVEATHQTVDPLTPFGEPTNAVEGADLKKTNGLPAVSLVYSATKKLKTRFSYTQTLARPQMRELAPFSFADYFGGQVRSGNPELTVTEIRNVDARVEYWPSLTEVMAFTTFFKYMKDPIEEIQRSTGGTPQVTYRNAPKAYVIGAEFEVRKNLGFLAPVLSPFSAISNLTLTHSRTEVAPEDAQILTTASYPLINQAPWVVNAALNYENATGFNARITYNVAGASLVQVGTEGLPNAYRHSFNSLDLSASQRLSERWIIKAQAENIINDNVLVTQGRHEEDVTGDGESDNIRLNYKKGATISVGVSYAL